MTFLRRNVMLEPDTEPLECEWEAMSISYSSTEEESVEEEVQEIEPPPEPEKDDPEEVPKLEVELLQCIKVGNKVFVPIDDKLKYWRCIKYKE